MEWQVFITDIRNCKNPEDEEQRVDRELANIRGKFKAEKNLTGKSHTDIACTLIFFMSALHNYIAFLFLQIMRKKNMSGSFFTSICLATMWSLVTYRELISCLRRSRSRVFPCICFLLAHIV